MSKTLTHLILVSAALLGLVGLFATLALAVDVTSGTEIFIRDIDADTTYEDDLLDARRTYTSSPGNPVEVRYGLVDFDLGGLFGTTVTSLEFHVDQLDLDDSTSIGSAAATLPIQMVGFLLDMDGATSIGSTTWNTYQAEHAGNETEFDSLGTMSLAGPGQSGGGFRFATGSSADIALVQDIIDNHGTLTMVIQPTDPGFNMAASFGDNESLGANSFLRINDVTSPYSVPEELSLHVNRFSGETRIVADDAPADTNTVRTTKLDSYVMGNASLNNVWVPSNWNSIADQDGGDWEEVDPTSPATTQNVLSELNLNGSKSISPGQSVSLGNVYDRTDASKDISFSYHLASGGPPLTGEVVIEGVGPHLRVNKSTGTVEIVNGETAGFDLDGYVIKSASGDLNSVLWNSLEDQSVTGWEETQATSSAISELNLASSSVLAGSSAWNLGTPYQGGVNGIEDISFQYRLVPGQIPEKILDGVVEYIVDPDATLRVDRRTGALTLVNERDGILYLQGYSITSAAGSLDQSGWIPISGNYDVNGSGSVDSNDEWTVLSNPLSDTDLSEFQFGGDGGEIGFGEEVVLSSGGAWIPSPANADLVMTIIDTNGSPVFKVVVEYVGHFLGDMDGNGVVEEADVAPFIQALTNRSAYTLAYPDVDADLTGDFDGNGLLDFGDVSGFSAAISALPASASAVPEPAGVLLLSLATCCLVGTVRRRTSDLAIGRSASAATRSSKSEV